MPDRVADRRKTCPIAPGVVPKLLAIGHTIGQAIGQCYGRLAYSMIGLDRECSAFIALRDWRHAAFVMR